MSEQFKREIRYDVIKLKTGLPVECVVVEDDWHPEYEIVWQMIQDRAEGRPNLVESLKLENEAYRSAWQNEKAKCVEFKQQLAEANKKLAEQQR